MPYLKPQKPPIPVGVVTYHHVFNYGAVLQAFALSKILESLGCAPIFLDYRPWRAELAYAYWFGLRRPSKLSQYLRANARMQEFIASHLNVTPWKCHRRSAVPLELPFETVVFGSDEIWDTSRFRGADPFYFGGFERANGRLHRISYGVSCGRLQKESALPPNFIGHLSRFESISVRDSRTEALVSRLTQKEITEVLDPTLLLPIATYPKTEPSVEKKYVLVFAKKPSEDLVNETHRLARRRGLSILSVGFPFPGADCVLDLGVESWLGYISQCELLVTNFFHGAIFGMRFSKEVFLDPKAPKNYKLEDLMRKVGSRGSSSGPLESYRLNGARTEEWTKKSFRFLFSALVDIH